MLVGGFGGDIMYYQGEPDGTFAAGTHLRFENGEYFLHAPILTETMKTMFPTEGSRQGMLAQDDSAAGIWVTDWDGDGDLDIVSGWFFGGLFLSRNNGTPTEPKLSAEFEPIVAGGEPITEVFQTEPVIADWDNDGRDDLIYGTRSFLKTNRSAIYWCRNTADKGDPVYEAPRKLMDDGPESQYTAPSIDRGRAFGSALTLSVIDWEGDGDLDLLVGDYAEMAPASDDITAEQYKELLALEVQKRELKDELMKNPFGDPEVNGALREKSAMIDAAQKQYKMYKSPLERMQAMKATDERPPKGRVWLLIRD